MIWLWSSSRRRAHFAQSVQALTSGASRSPGRGRPGFMLILVLGTIILCAMIVTEFNKQVVEEIRYAGLFHEREDIRAESYSYFEAVMGVLHELREIDEALYGGAQGWADPLAYAGVEVPSWLDVQVAIEDETGKFSLTRLSEDLELSRRLFETLGFDLQTSDELHGALKDWTDENDEEELVGGAETDYYESLDPPFAAANSAVESWEEFRLIRYWSEAFFDPETGRPNERFQLFRSAVSLYHDSEVNENNATPLVQQVLQTGDSFDRQALNDYLAGFDRIPGTADDRVIMEREEAAAYVPENSGIVAEVLNVRLSARRGEAVFVIDALVATEGSGSSGATGRAATRQEDEDEQIGRASRDQERRQLTGRAQADVNRENLTEVRQNESDTPEYPFQIIRLYENYLP